MLVQLPHDMSCRRWGVLPPPPLGTTTLAIRSRPRPLVGHVSCGQPLKVGRELADYSGDTSGVRVKPLRDFPRHGSCESNAFAGFPLPRGRPTMRAPRIMPTVLRLNLSLGLSLGLALGCRLRLATCLACNRGLLPCSLQGCLDLMKPLCWA